MLGAVRHGDTQVHSRAGTASEDPSQAWESQQWPLPDTSRTSSLYWPHHHTVTATNMERAITRRLTRVAPALSSEAEALRAGVQMIHSVTSGPVIMETDSLELVNLWKHKATQRSEFAPIFQDGNMPGLPSPSGKGRDANCCRDQHRVNAEGCHERMYRL